MLGKSVELSAGINSTIARQFSLSNWYVSLQCGFIIVANDCGFCTKSWMLLLPPLPLPHLPLPPFLPDLTILDDCATSIYFLTCAWKPKSVKFPPPPFPAPSHNVRWLCHKCFFFVLVPGRQWVSIPRFFPVVKICKHWLLRKNKYDVTQN